jgi:cobalt-zinc-cadmium efflux system membrane fusion protein
VKYTAKLYYVATAVALLASCGEKKGESVAASDKPISEAKVDPNKIVIPQDSPQLKEIKVETVENGSVPANEVTAPGKIETNPNRVSHVVLPVAGRVVSVNCKIGDSVTQGQTLLVVESPDADTAVSAYLQAQAGVAQARTALLKAKTDLERSRDLYEHKAVAQKDVLAAQATADQAQANVDQAVAGLLAAQRKLSILGLKPENVGQQINVTAPISGKILELNVVPGEFRNDLSASLITIADLSTVWISSDVPESDIRFIDPGEQLDIELTAYPGEVFHGKVTRVADTVDPQTRTVKVRGELNNSHGRLRPEMFGTVKHAEGFTRVPVIPAAAVLANEGSSLVYKELSPGTFQAVTVTLGPHVGDKVAVNSGLKVGDRVVTDGVMLLKSN